MNTFFTSDSHYHHKNIIKYCNRPFHDIEEMKEGLIERWNKVVSEGDTVYHLGDFAFGGISAWEEIIPRLNGNITLILGNHDLKQHATNKDIILDSFKEVCFQKQIIINDNLIYMNHYPLLCYPDPLTNWNLFGHVHSGPNYNGSDKERLKYLYPTQYDVGVDNNNYAPIAYEEVKQIITKQLYENLCDK